MWELHNCRGPYVLRLGGGRYILEMGLSTLSIVAYIQNRHKYHGRDITNVKQTGGSVFDANEETSKYYIQIVTKVL